MPIDPEVYKFLAVLVGIVLRTLVPFANKIIRGEKEAFQKKYLLPAVASLLLSIVAAVFLTPSIPATETSFVGIAAFAYTAQDIFREGQKKIE